MCELVGREDLWFTYFLSIEAKFISVQNWISKPSITLSRMTQKYLFVLQIQTKEFQPDSHSQVLCCRIEVAPQKEDLQIYQIKSTKSMEDIQFKKQQKRYELIDRWYSSHPIEISLLNLHGIINHRQIKKLMLYFCIIIYFYP